MAKAYKLEDPGEGINEVEIVEIHVHEGDQVKDGDTLISVETDKAANDIPAPFNGTIESIEVKEGDKVTVGTTLVKYNGADEGESEGARKEDRAQDDEKSASGEGSQSQKQKKDQESEDNAEEDERKQESNQSRSKEPHAQESQPEKKSDQKAQEGKAEDKAKGARSKQGNGHERPVPAAPATRQLARELEVDLHQVEPSGPGGRVTREDVQAFADQSRDTEPREEGTEERTGEGEREDTAAAQRPPAPAEAPELPDFTQWGEIERQPLRSIRRAVARQMALSWAQIPHVMHQSVADITELERFRQRHKDRVAERGGKLTLTVLVFKATLAALKQYPRFNASIDMANEEIILKQHYHLGMAVATEHGLVVPVIRHADRKDITQLAIETARIAEQARNGELKREDMAGATFSITNPGPIGATSFTPIINYPEAAILGMCSSYLAPVVTGDLDDFQVEARLQLPLCLAYDHRLNDGAEAAQFLKYIVDLLRNPEAFLLSV